MIGVAIKGPISCLIFLPTGEGVRVSVSWIQQKNQIPYIMHTVIFISLTILDCSIANTYAYSSYVINNY